MSTACRLNLAFPVVGALVLLWLRPPEGSVLDDGFLLWFGVGAVLQLAAALVLTRRNHGSWVLGWVLLWLASASYMGAYAPVHLQEDALSGNWATWMAPEPKLPKELEKEAGEQHELPARVAEWRQHRDEAAAWLRTTFAADVLDDAFRTRAKADIGRAGLLLYVLSAIFLSAFFSIGWFAGRHSLHEYGVSGGSEEDPLAVNTMGRDPA
ncbi:MAG: hypothetical protein R3F30_13735 [Planctomycetota bacterium]